MIKSTFLAVATAAAAFAAMAVTTTSANAQDWRRGTFEERPGAHRFGEFCINRVVAHGFAPISFELSPSITGKVRARILGSDRHRPVSTSNSQPCQAQRKMRPAWP